MIKQMSKEKSLILKLEWNFSIENEDYFFTYESTLTWK